MAAALLFDLDGTLLESDPIHRLVFEELMRPFGIAVDMEHYLDRIHGRLNTDYFAEAIPDHPDHHGLSERKEALFRERLPNPCPAIPGAAEFMEAARAGGIRIGIVTNAMRENAEAMLSATGLARFAETLVIGGECARAKPHPDPFLAGMRNLGSGPDTTLIFEDSPSGVEAARASRARVTGVRSSLDDASLRSHGADITIADFEDPALGAELTHLKGATA